VEAARSSRNATAMPLKFKTTFVEKVGKFSDRPWFLPFLGFLAGADHFISVVPVDALLMSSILLRPKRWPLAALCFMIGSSAGAILLGYVVSIYGDSIVQTLFGNLESKDYWIQSKEWAERYGVWTVFGLAIGPFPVFPGVVLLMLAKQSLFKVSVAIVTARTIKYTVLSVLISKTPRLFKKYLKKELEQ
jgi:membrane protein YqaA with SNARE-associated domain